MTYSTFGCRAYEWVSSSNDSSRHCLTFLEAIERLRPICCLSSFAHLEWFCPRPQSICPCGCSVEGDSAIARDIAFQCALVEMRQSPSSFRGKLPRVGEAVCLPLRSTCFSSCQLRNRIAHCLKSQFVKLKLGAKEGFGLGAIFRNFVSSIHRSCLTVCELKCEMHWNSVPKKNYDVDCSFSASAEPGYSPVDTQHQQTNGMYEKTEVWWSWKSGVVDVDFPSLRSGEFTFIRKHLTFEWTISEWKDAWFVSSRKLVRSNPLYSTPDKGKRRSLVVAGEWMAVIGGASTKPFWKESSFKIMEIRCAIVLKY